MHAGKLFMMTGCRKFHADNKLKVIFHQFSHEEAEKIFAKHDSSRLLAPKNITESASLNKVLLPFFGCHAHVSKTDYLGSYGVNHIGFKADVKGHITSYTYTVWHDTKGSLGPHTYSDSDSNLRVYSGYTWDNNVVENAFRGFDVVNQLKFLEANHVDENIAVDPFLMSYSTVEEVFKNCINSYERARVEKDINIRKDSSNISVEKLQCQYEGKIVCYLLPAYIENKPGHPSRILSALNINQAIVHGANPVSVAKTTVIAFVASTIISVAMPQLAIPAKIACALAGPAVTALYTKHRLGMIRYFQESKMKREKLNNQALIEKESPKPIEAPKIIIEVPEIKVTQAILKHARILGLKEGEC